MEKPQIFLLTEKEKRYYDRVNNVIDKVCSRPEFTVIGDDGRQRFVFNDTSLAAIRDALERSRVSIPALTKKAHSKMTNHYFTIGYLADRDGNKISDTLHLLLDINPRGYDVPQDSPIYTFTDPIRKETEQEADYWRARRAELELPDDFYYLNCIAWSKMRFLDVVISLLNGDTVNVEPEEINGPFVQMVQTRVTNSLVLLNTQEAKKQIGLDGTATIKLADDLTVTIAGIDGKERKVTTTDLMLLDAILITYTTQRNPNRVILPLQEYAALRGVTDMKSLRKQVLKGLAFWKTFGYNTVEIIDGKKAPSGTIGICGGTALIKQGNIIFNFNPDFRSALEVLAPLDYAKETLSLDPKTSQYYFSRFIDAYYRINEGRPQANKISVLALMEKSPNIPSYEEVAASNRAYTARIITPFIADLDALDRITYDIVDVKGNIVEKPEEMSIHDFLNAYVQIDYWDYPTHEERVQKKQLRAASKKKTKKRGKHISKDQDTPKS